MGTFVATVTIVPFIPDGCAESARGFPAMIGPVAFLMKDVVLLAVAVYLLKEDRQGAFNRIPHTSSRRV
ncbi:DUF417 family protein [Cupriavidus sp. CP313]